VNLQVTAPDVEFGTVYGVEDRPDLLQRAIGVGHRTHDRRVRLAVRREPLVDAPAVTISGRAGIGADATGAVRGVTTAFAVTWDYRCPFARNAHEHVLTALAAGADWEVRFVPFSLGQAHVEEGEVSVWDEPAKDTGILALQVGVVVRDEFADRFPAVHRGLFAARHDEGLHLEDRVVVEKVLTEHGVPADVVFDRVDSGAALATVREEHEAFVASHTVWGVPTFVAGEEAVFVRLMDRSPVGSEPAPSIRAVERVVDLLTGWPELNEFKHTTVPR
jgi:DSBA-like thioredoxin domain-containing protein